MHISYHTYNNIRFFLLYPIEDREISCKKFASYNKIPIEKVLNYFYSTVTVSFSILNDYTQTNWFIKRKLGFILHIVFF